MVKSSMREAETEGQERLTAALGDGKSLVSERDSFGRELCNATGAITENLNTAKATLEELQERLRR
ncbi:hypothetical protein GCM10010191_18790 [Actinomadura vinacea]|uniref:CsbD family protein n=1 Tax=Actinomadura vinacea TaxID=115336 RepID=A0ABN3IPL5_9ACTN